MTNQIINVNEDVGQSLGEVETNIGSLSCDTNISECRHTSHSLFADDFIKPAILHDVRTPQHVAGRVQLIHVEISREVEVEPLSVPGHCEVYVECRVSAGGQVNEGAWVGWVLCYDLDSEGHWVVDSNGTWVSACWGHKLQP